MDILETFSDTLVQTFVIRLIRRFSPQPILNNFLINLIPLVTISTKDVANR